LERRVNAEKKKAAANSGEKKLSDEELNEIARQVLESKDPLDDYRAEYERLGYGGDLDPIMLLTLSLTTRLLKMRRGTMPAHTGVIGPPSIGKSFTVQTALSVFPKEAYHTIDAGSPRVLIYDPEELKHRVLLFSESDSLPASEDNPAASAIRNLCQDHRLHYSVVVKDLETGTFTVKEIDKDGPTTLVTTAVRFIGGQLGTRLFLVEVPEDVKRLQQALAAQAKAEVKPPVQPDQALIAYQSILQRKAPIDVIVPFAPILSEEIGRSANAGRILRDFQRILSLVKAVTVLRYPHREKGNDDRLISTIDDYEAVFDLVDRTYQNTVSEASQGTRDLVKAVADLEAITGKPLTLSHVAKGMAIHIEQVKRQARRAIKQGWLVNEEEKKGRPAKLTCKGADPLPESAGLPSPDLLRGKCEPVNPGNVTAVTVTGIADNSTACDTFTPPFTGSQSSSHPREPE
jgi:hypothetical protein